MRLRELFEAPEPDVIDRPPTTDRPPVQQRQEVPLYVPGGATVVIMNDDVTPYEVVIEAVVHGTGLSPAEASRRVNQSHREGWAPVASYGSRDIAETVANRIEQHARSNNRYDHYRPLIPYNGPWPLAAEVLDADQAQ